MKQMDTACECSIFLCLVTTGVEVYMYTLHMHMYNLVLCIVAA